jgi:hypothetical protein
VLAVKAVIMTNESGQPENASYAQAKGRKILDQGRKRHVRLEQGAEIRAALEKASSAQSKEAQAAPSPETPGPIAAMLELLSGRNAPDLADLSEAAVRKYTALKSAFTLEQETALRGLESGKGSTLATARIFRAPSHLLDVLADIPLVWKVWQLVEMLNAPPKKWNGYLDPYWTIGQTVLWIVAGDPWVVDQASNDSGRLDELSGQLMAAELIDNLNLPPEHVQDAADRLRRLCLDGTMTAIDGRDRPIPAIIPAIEWLYLEIVLDDGNVLAIQHVGQSTIMPAYSHVVFSRVEVLREFSPEGRSEDQDVTAPPPRANAIDTASQDDAVATLQMSDGAAVRIEVKPYSIDRENPDDTPQIGLARFVARRRWGDGDSSAMKITIPRAQATDIRAALNVKLKELHGKNELPLEQKDEVKPRGLSLPTVRRLLGLRDD